MKIWNVNWLEENSNRNYPFYDFASLKNNIFEIPKDFLVDLSFTTVYNDELDISKFYLKYLTHTKNYILLDFYYGEEPFVQFNIDKNNHTKNKSYIINKDGLYQSITIQTLHTINTKAQGRFTFNIEATRILPGCIRVFIDCVRKIVVKKNDVIFSELFGEVGLEPGSNIQILKTGNNIEISAISDSELNLVDDCTEDIASTSPIRTINGITPDENGNINIIGGPGIKVETNDNNINLSDEYCTPCCGDEEIKIILDELKKFTEQKAKLESFLTDMEQKFIELQMLVSGSNKSSDKCHD